MPNTTGGGAKGRMMREFDFIVVGSGVAGLSFALDVAEHGSVALITKGCPAESNTAWAQGGISCVTSERRFLRAPHRRYAGRRCGALRRGCGPDYRVREGPARIEELVGLRRQFDTQHVENGYRGLRPREGRGTHAAADPPFAGYHGARDLEPNCSPPCGRTSGISLMENHFAVDLITTGQARLCHRGPVHRDLRLDRESGEVETFRSDRVILCTGGSGRVYQYTTNPDVATGDGVAMAWRAGRDDFGHGIHPVSSDLSLPPRAEVVSDLRGSSR